MSWLLSGARAGKHVYDDELEASCGWPLLKLLRTPIGAGAARFPTQTGAN